jgi:hypothetical protein
LPPSPRSVNDGAPAPSLAPTIGRALRPPRRPRTTEECGRSAALGRVPEALSRPIYRGVDREGRKRQFCAVSVLTRPKANAYIALLRRAAARRDGAPSKLLTDTGGQASDHGRRPKASTALRVSGGGNRPVPGCLTGESEERETWTAESLRAASACERVRPDETSAVSRFRSTLWPRPEKSGVRSA